MPAVFSTFQLPLDNDGIITISLEPPTQISGYDIQCDLLQNFNGNPIFSTYLTSGLPNGASGITVTNSTVGIISLYFPSLITSGFPAGNYPFDCYRTSGGIRSTDLAQGFRIAN